MKVLRSTFWRAPNDPGVITVVRDCDMTEPLESVRDTTTEAANREGGLVLSDLFEMPNDSNFEATLRAGARTRERFFDTERHQAMLYYWTVSQWGIVSPGGGVASTRPAPLSADEIKEVLVQLARHPQYEGYLHVVPARDGTIVTMRNGECRDDS